MKKRYFLFPLLLLLAALLSITLTVSAENAPEAYWGASADALTVSGTLQDAVDAAQYDLSVKYIKLNTDVGREIYVNGGKFTLDLAGHSISSDSYTLDVRNTDTEVTVTDTVGGGRIVSTESGSSAITLMGGATMTIEDGTMVSAGCAIRTWHFDPTTLTLNGGTYNGTVEAVGQVVVNGGVFDSEFYISGTESVLTLNEFTTVDGGTGTVEFREGRVVVNTEKSIQFYIMSSLEESDVNECFTLPNGLFLIDSNGNRVTQASGGTIATIGVDTVKPVIKAYKVRRTEPEKAEIYIKVSEGGRYYYARVPSGAPRPAVDTSGEGQAYADAFTLSLTGLTAGLGEDVYFVIKDAAGNLSELVKVSIPTSVSYPLSVAGIAVNESNAHDILGELDGARASAKYDHATKTLTLDGFVYTCNESGLDPAAYGYGVIHAESAITIRLVGKNEIRASGSYLIEGEGLSSIDAISFRIVDGDVFIVGEGSLLLTGNGDGVDIRAEGTASLTVGENAAITMRLSSEGFRMEAAGDVTLTVKDHTRVTIDNAEESIYLISTFGKETVTFKDNAYYYSTTSDEEGIYAESDESLVTVSDNAHVTVDGDEEGIQVNCVTVTGGSLAVYAHGSYEGIYCETLTVSGGTLIVDGGEDFYSVYADFITFTGGTVIVRNRGAEYRALLYAPDLSEYEGNYVARASFHSDGTELMPYDLESNDEYLYFILAPEGTRVIWPVYGEAKQSPLLTTSDRYTLPVYDGPIPLFSVFEGWSVGDALYQAGDSIPLSSDVTVRATFRVLPQKDPVIDLTDMPSLEFYTSEDVTYIYDYERDTEIPYTGTVTLTGNGANGYIDVYAGSYAIIFDNVTLMSNNLDPMLVLNPYAKVSLTLKGENRLAHNVAISAIDISSNAELAVTFDENASLNLAVGLRDDTPGLPTEPVAIDLGKAANDTESDAILTFASAGGTHMTLVKGKAESPFDAPTTAEITALCAEEAFTLGAHAFSRIESERAKKSGADCKTGATYYLSCEHCSRMSEETFVSETLAPHTYVDGTCTVCGAEEPDEGSLLWLWILLPTVALAGGGAALYFFVFKKRFA